MCALLHEQGYEDEHIETSLAHLKRNKVSAAYNYAKYLEPRTKIMQDWANFLEQQLQEAMTPKAVTVQSAASAGQPRCDE